MAVNDRPTVSKGSEERQAENLTASNAKHTAGQAAQRGRQRGKGQAKTAVPTANQVQDPSKKDLRDKFREAHTYIKEHVVGAEPPKGELDLATHFEVSKLTLENYVTLDWQHREEIEGLISKIQAYARDPSRRRPLNVMMQAEPGSGKSHFIKCLARKMTQDGLSEVTFNMASLQGVDDFIQPLEAVRNLKVVDRLPLLFLDEFDSSKDNYPLLLPLMWDGELNVGHRELRIGKVVIILAGSSGQIEDAMKLAKGMQRGAVMDGGKLSDLLSRINGGELTIPGLDEIRNDRDRRVDKICLTLSLLRQRFGQRLVTAPWALLRFVADTKFRYGVRSVAHLIDVIPPPKSEARALNVRDLGLPLGSVAALKSSSLAYHLLAEDGPAAVIDAWKQVSACDVPVQFERTFEFGQWWRTLFLPRPGGRSAA